jgi:hypothetical protein
MEQLPDQGKGKLAKPILNRCAQAIWPDPTGDSRLSHRFSADPGRRFSHPVEPSAARQAGVPLSGRGRTALQRDSRVADVPCAHQHGVEVSELGVDVAALPGGSING